jgi:hypothetical protein
MAIFTYCINIVLNFAVIGMFFLFWYGAPKKLATLNVLAPGFRSADSAVDVRDGT